MHDFEALEAILRSFQRTEKQFRYFVFWDITLLKAMHPGYPAGS